MQKRSRGGVRTGAGRKQGYGEPTSLIRVPQSQLGTVVNFLEVYKQQKTAQSVTHERVVSDPSPVAMEAAPLTIPVMLSLVPAGFPSPCDDYYEQGLDLNEHLILHKAATFIFKVSGWSMINAGIHDGDEIIVDRAIEPKDKHIVVAVLNNTLTVKRFRKSHTDKTIRLEAENPEFPDIVIGAEEELIVWGVVTRVLHIPS